MTMTIAKTQLKQEIDQLDDRYLELVYKILRQFPHLEDTTPQQLFPEPLQKSSLLEVLATLEEIEDEFPDIDENLLPLDDINL